LLITLRKLSPHKLYCILKDYHTRKFQKFWQRFYVTPLTSRLYLCREWQDKHFCWNLFDQSRDVITKTTNAISQTYYLGNSPWSFGHNACAMGHRHMNDIFEAGSVLDKTLKTNTFYVQAYRRLKMCSYFRCTSMLASFLSRITFFTNYV